MQTEGVGDAPENVGDNNETQTPEEKKVAWDDHQRALDDMHRYKKAAKEHEQRLKQIETNLSKEQNEKLKSKELVKELAEKLELENTELRAKLESRDQAYINTQKYNALMAAANNAGLRKEALNDLELLDLEDIEVEATSNGRFLVNGVDSYVETLVKTKPHWFNDPKVPKFNSGGASNTEVRTEEITPKMLGELRVKDYKKYREMLPKYLEQKQRSK